MPSRPTSGTEIIKHDFFHPLSFRYHAAGVVIIQGDAMIWVVRADLPEFLDEITRIIHLVRGMELHPYDDEDDEISEWDEDEEDDEPDDGEPEDKPTRHVRISGRRKK